MARVQGQGQRDGAGGRTIIPCRRPRYGVLSMMTGMDRRQALLQPAVATALAAWAGPLWPGPARPAPGLKVLRLASESETGFNPARVRFSNLEHSRSDNRAPSPVGTGGGGGRGFLPDGEE